MADALPVMIWALDAVGKSTYYNKQAIDFIGHTEEELIDGKCWQSVIHAYDILSTSEVDGDIILHQQPCGEGKYDFNYSLRQNSLTQNTRELRFPK